MTNAFGLFDERTIRLQLTPESHELLRFLTLLDKVDSTNQHLQRLAIIERHGHAVVADQQSTGRGRRGRDWHSPGGSNIYLSLGWDFQLPATSLVRLPLAVAVMVNRALRRAGISSPGIKWPNDILVEGRKLAGVLVELGFDGADRSRAVIGVGINVRMPEDESSRVAIDQPWTDVCSHIGHDADNSFRDRLCGMLLEEILQGVAQFSTENFQSFKDEWNSLDVLNGREVTVTGESEPYSGTACGISTSGALLIRNLDINGKPQVRECYAGEVSVRQANR